MREIVSQYPRLFAMSAVVLAAIVWTALVISRLSGWRRLAQLYRTEREFPEHKRRMQTALMRGGIRYNNILTLGSDAEGLYLRIPMIFRLGHPPLFVPWADIAVDEPKRWLFFMLRTLWLGPDGIPLRVREPLAEFLLEPRSADRSINEPSGSVSQPGGMKWGI